MSGWKRWLIPAAALPVLGLLAFGLTRDAQKLPSALTGEPAPAFGGPTLAGDTLALADLRGRAVVLNFWASWCVPCRQEHPALRRAEAAWSDDRVRVVGVLYQDSRANARRFMARHGGRWPTVLDPGSRIAIDYGVYGVPETFFIAPDGTVARKHTGPLSWPRIRAAVDSLIGPDGGGENAGTPTPGAADPESGARAPGDRPRRP